MANFLKKSSIVLGVIGIIGSLLIAKMAGEENYREFNWEKAIYIFIAEVFCVLFLTIFIYWMGEVADHLSNISRYIKLSLPDDKKQMKSIYNKDNSWICKKCEKMNFLYNTTCSCGQRKEDNI